MTILSFSILLLVVQGFAAFASAQTSSLRVSWERPLPAAQTRTIYRTAVCPDGTAFAINSRGAVTGFDGTGALVVETIHPDIFDATAAACDASNRLFIWNGEAIVTFAAQGGALVSGDRRSVRGHVLEILPSGGELFLLTFNSLARGVVVRLGSLQAEPVTVAQLDSLDDPQSVVHGRILRYGTQRLIGVVPGGRYELRVFDREGKLAAIRPRFDASFPLVESPAGLFPVRRGPRSTVLAVFVLPDRRFVAQVARYEEASPDHFKGAATLEILDETFSLVETVGGPYVGRLAGVSSDGALYFMDIRPSGGRLIKAKLVAAE